MKEYLFKNNLPVKKLAAELKISVSYLYQLIRKERRPSLELALRIEQYTQGEVSAKELLEKKEGDLFSLDEYLNTTRNQIERNLKVFENRIQKLEEKFKALEKIVKGG